MRTLSFTAVSAVALAAQSPNFIFIVADDLGLNEMGFNNASRGILTPHLDALAAQGVVMDRYYTNPLCSPSRSALMTGLYNHRIGTQANVVYWDTPWAPSLDLQFLPQALQGHGYVSAMYGKWHLGMYKEEYYPINRGFDEHLGYLQGCGSQDTHISSCCDAPANATNFTSYVCPGSNPADPTGPDFRGYDWFNGTTPVLDGAVGVSSTEMVAAAAEAFLARQSTDTPFFLYTPFQNIHAPYDCTQESVALFANLTGISLQQQIMYGYIYELDVAVGRIVAALPPSIAENTIIIFVSDNGAPPAPNVTDRNYPLSGFKGQVYEGGVRVPAFVHAPTRLQGGRRVNGYVHVSDWFPTLLALASSSSSGEVFIQGRNMSSGEAYSLDGVNIWPTLVSDTPVRTEFPVNINPLPYHGPTGGQFDVPKAAYVLGDLKLICYFYTIAGVNGSSTTGCLPDPSAPAGTWPKLFNITADPGETTNLAPTMPAAVAALEARLAAVAAASVEPMVWDPPYQGPSYTCAACPKHARPGIPFQPWQAWL